MTPLDKVDNLRALDGDTLDLRILESAEGSLRLIGASRATGEIFILHQDSNAEALERARVAFANLTYSESLGVKALFSFMKDYEDTIVCAHIADKAGVSRASVMLAIQKLHNYGVLEAHAMGARGTHIKITNKFIVQLVKEASK